MFVEDEAALAPEAGTNGDGEEGKVVGSRFKCWSICKPRATTSSAMELEIGLVTSTRGSVLSAAVSATAGLELVGMSRGAEDDKGWDIMVCRWKSDKNSFFDGEYKRSNWGRC